MRIKDIVIIPIMTSIIVITSWINIPLVIPFTLSIFGISLTLALIGGKKGILSILIYIVLGLIGVPVFSGMKSGLGVILGPTGGFIIGYLLMGISYFIFEKIIRIKLINLIICLIVCYLCGIIWYKFVYQSDLSIINIICTIIIPFIIPDILKLILSCFISTRIRKILNKLS